MKQVSSSLKFLFEKNLWDFFKLIFFSVKKFDEVLGMITFANEIIAHMNQMGAAVDKEKTKRLQAEQSQTESDKLEVHSISNFSVFRFLMFSTPGVE